MKNLTIQLIKRVFPDYEQIPDLGKNMIWANIVTIAFNLPLALIGIIWLAWEIDIQVILEKPLLWIFVFASTLFLTRYIFFIFVEIEDNQYIDLGSSLSPLIFGATLWLFGAIAILIFLVTNLISIYRNFATLPNFNALVGLNALRIICLTFSAGTFFVLVALEIYTVLDGTYPFASLTLSAIVPAIVASLIIVITNLLTWLPFLWMTTFSTFARQNSSPKQRKIIMIQFLLMASTMLLTFAFSIVGASIYQFINIEFFIVFNIGILLVAYLGYMMSRAVERNRQRSVELAKLEQLGQALLNAPPDASTLDVILRSHVQDMFFQSNLEIRQFPDKILLPAIQDTLQNDYPINTKAWDNILTQTDMQIFPANTDLPWGGQVNFAHVFAPIKDEFDENLWGGIWLATPARQIDRLLPSLQSVASQISATLRSARIYAENLTHEKTKQELAIAAEIQNSFLPDVVPQIEGWQLAVSLEPARQTSGDFYDFIPLEDGKLGIVVADVADKGTGAALFMALSRTLIRTYARQYPSDPARVFLETNQRILEDTHNDLFVTIFYGILEPTSGTLQYANAGHNPAYLRQDNCIHELKRTGIPLGMMENMQWRNEEMILADEAVLALYTDGVTEAQNDNEDLFEEQRLKTLIENNSTEPAAMIRTTILEAIYQFVDTAPQADDITLLVLKKSI